MGRSFGALGGLLIDFGRPLGPLSAPVGHLWGASARLQPQISTLRPP